MSTCYVNQTLNQKKCCSNNAFSGITHSLSALAFFFIMAGFYPTFLYNVSGGKSVWNIIASCLIIIGFSLFPDLDNTRSTAHSALGFFGTIMSKFVRFTSVLVQKIVGTKYDKDRDNPHRKLWHTPFWWMIISIILFYVLSIPTMLKIDNVISISVGNIVGFMLLYVSTLIASSSLVGDILRKAKKGLFLGDILVSVLVLFFTIILYSNISTVSVQWMVGPVLFGALIHILGDMFTIYGCPVLFPLIVRGKFFYNISFAPIQSGGTIEKVGFTTVFVLLIGVGIIKLAGVL